jgi:lipopolysaccharide assembly outer membrane protein LptD (OstA)
MLLTRQDISADFSIKVDVAYDFEDYVDTITINTADFKQASGKYAQLEVYPSRQKCQAIKFRISDLSITSITTNRGLALSGLRLMVGVKNTNNKLSASQKTSTV